VLLSLFLFLFLCLFLVVFVSHSVRPMSRLARFHGDLVDVTPDPVFSRLE
jgi:hypothetical protein